MNQKEWKQMKKDVVRESAYGVGFFDGIFEKIPDYALVAAVRNMATEHWISNHTDDGTIRNMLVTECIREMNYQDFKEVAPYLFSYPREQREQDKLVYPIEVSREYFETLKRDAEELFQIKQNLESLDRKILELETDRVASGDEVLGFNLEKEELLLLRTPETSYIDDWEVAREGLITDYHSPEESDYQTLSYLMEAYPALKSVFYEEVLNRDRYDTFVAVEKDLITEVVIDAIPDFETHRAFYNYGQQFESFKREFQSYADYIIETYERDYPTDYGLKFYCDGLPDKYLKTINQELARDNKELVLHLAFGYSQGDVYSLAYLRDTLQEEEGAVRYYLEHRVGAYYRGSLTEAAVIPLSSIDPDKGYDGQVVSKYLIDTEELSDNYSKLERIQNRYQELLAFTPLEKGHEITQSKELKGLSL
ncbi:hypothetical protein ACVR1I_03070 [Streptococcus cameli]